MGRRFKEISTGDGWRKIVRLENYLPTATVQHQRRNSGKYHSFNAHAPKVPKNGNKQYRHRPPFTKRYDNTNVSPHLNGTSSYLNSLLSYQYPSQPNKISLPKSQILNLLQTEHTIHSPPSYTQTAMTKKKHTYIQVAKQTNTSDTMITPGRNFPNTNTPPNNIHLIQNPSRYPQPIWKSYLDSNPWTFASPSNALPTSEIISDQPEPLPLPPDPTHPRWRGRCYNCLVIGHDQNECTGGDRVCARCWHTGHAARSCTFIHSSKLPPFDPLMPRGNMGDSAMPKNRPKITMVFIPETNQMQHDACEMLRAIVIDARLREHHNLHILQSILMATSATPYPFPISKTNDTQYLLVLPPGINREAFLTAHSANLRETGYVAFPWSASVNGTPLQMTYKVWVELKGMSPCSWTVEHLLHAAGSFGIVLEHAPMANRASLERMRAVVAVPSLELVPEYAGVWVRGIMRKVLVTVHAWIEEPIPNSAPPDTTPTNEFFEQVRHSFSPLPAVPSEHALNQERLTVDFDTLFAIWPTLEDGTEKSKIEGILKKSPLFAARLGATVMASSTKNLDIDMVQGIQSGELEVNGPKENGQDPVNERGHNSIYGGTATVQRARGKNILPGTVQTALTLQGQSDTPPQQTAGVGCITSEDVDSAGAKILKAILSGPSKAQSELEQNIAQKNQLPPKNLSFADSPPPRPPQNYTGLIEVDLYPKELTGVVSLPADVHPQIAANFAANLGPHHRCLQPYLTLPPTPLSHPWIYTQEEIEAYKAKLVRSATEPDEGPNSLEFNTGTEQPDNRGDSESELGDEAMDYQGVNEEVTNMADLSDKDEQSADGSSDDSNERVRKLPKGDAPTPRRSRRISERASTAIKTHSPKKTRKPKDPSGKGKQPANPALVAQITDALQEEQLELVPLQQVTVQEVSNYCGTHLGDRLIPLEGAASNQELRDALTAGFDMDESILKSLEYNPEEDDFTDYEEEMEDEQLEVEPEVEPMEEEPEEDLSD